MNTPQSFELRILRRAAAVGAGLVTLLGFSQVAPAPDAAALAKYDVNRNGRLDPDELLTMQSDQDRAASGGTSSSLSNATPDSVVKLSPFEVVEDTKGYYSANTISGTRFNAKLDDLASNITIVTK